MRLLILAMIAATACPALAAERRYSVGDFDRIQVDGPYRVTVTTGGSTSARASGSTAALDRLTVDVQNRTLRVRTNASTWGGYPGATTELATVALTTRSIQSAAVNGSGALAIDKARGFKFSVSLVGSGQTSIGALECDNLLVNLMGSGTASLIGKAKSVRAEVHGTARLDASQLTVDDAQVIADTAGNIALTVTRAVTIQATGAGDVDIGGTPACTVSSVGVGQIRCGRR